MAHVTLIRPAAVQSGHSYSLTAGPLLGLAYVAGALVAAGHEVEVIDAFGEALFAAHVSVHPRLVCFGLDPAAIVARIPAHTQAVGVSVMFSQQWPDVEALLRAVHARFPRLPTVAGGEHATAT